MPAPVERLTPPEVLAALQAALGEAYLSGEVREWREGGAEAPPYRQVWLRLAREGLRPLVQQLIALHYPHLAVIAAVDCGDTIELPYLFALYHGCGHDEIRISATVLVPKADPVVDSICDLIPGALLGEREKQEMMGVQVRGIPDGRRMFLPDDFPEGVYPWRRDETGIPPEMVKRLWETGREGLTVRDAEKAQAEAAAKAAAAAEAAARPAEPLPEGESS